MTAKTFTRAPVKHDGFFLGGNAVFTVEVSPEFVASHRDVKDHYTFKIVHKEASQQWPACHMVLMLVGPDNGNDFTYLGKLRNGQCETTAKSHRFKNSWPLLILNKLLICAVEGRLDEVEANGWRVMHEGRCCVCGRRLTVPSSIDAGIGPECAGK